MRHLAVGQLWAQERIRDKTLRLDKVAGEANPADIGTKHLGAEVMRRCMALAGLVPREGRSSAAPALTAQVQPFLDERAARGPPPRPQPAVRALLSVQGPRPQRQAQQQSGGLAPDPPGVSATLRRGGATGERSQQQGHQLNQHGDPAQGVLSDRTRWLPPRPPDSGTQRQDQNQQGQQEHNQD